MLVLPTSKRKYVSVCEESENTYVCASYPSLDYDGGEEAKVYETKTASSGYDLDGSICVNLTAPGVNLTSGRWHFCVTLGHEIVEEYPDDVRIGWVTSAFSTENLKIGDNKFSWAFGCYKRLWHDSSSTHVCPEVNPGDTVSFGIDIELGLLRFAINGKWQEDAFSQQAKEKIKKWQSAKDSIMVQTKKFGDGLRPGISLVLRPNTKYTINWSPKYPPPFDWGKTCKPISEAIEQNKKLAKAEIKAEKIGGLVLFRKHLCVSARKYLDTFHTRNLSELIMNDMELSNDGVEQLSEYFERDEFRSVHKIDLSLNEIENIGQFTDTLKKLMSLRDLNLSKNPLSAKGMQQLGEILITPDSNLENIDISNIQTDSAGVVVLGEQLQKYTKDSFKYLNISCNNIGMDGLTSILPATKYLFHLDLSNTGIGDEGTKLLFEAFSNGAERALTRIDISKNKIGEEGAAYIGKMLATVSRDVHKTIGLKEIIMHTNRIKDLGCQYIFEGLTYNYETQVLDLSSNSITDESVKDIANIVTKDQTLTHIHLRHNDITYEAVRKLASACKVNNTLKLLDLGWNRSSDKGAEAIADMLQHNSTLTHINLERNQITERGVEKLETALTESERHESLYIQLNLNYSLKLQGLGNRNSAAA